MVGGDNHTPLSRDVLATDSAETEVDVEERLQDRAQEPVDERVGALLASSPMPFSEIHRTLAYPPWPRPLQLLDLTGDFDRTRTLRGAVCGAVAGAIWALEQPLDKLLLSSPYDDVELLGKAVTRGEGWYPVGLVLHLLNSAAFGAAYANLAPALPVPALVRGPTLAFAQHLAFWPLGAVADRFHPARKELPRFAGNRRAFVQSGWRHLLFGVVLGELERRLNAVPEPVPPEPEADYSSNGQGTLDHALPVTSSGWASGSTDISGSA